MDTSINSQDVIGKDPFGRFLFLLKLKPWQAALISLSIFIAYVFVLPVVWGVLLPRTGLERSSLEDRVNQVGFLLIHPAVIFFYVWQPGALAKLYHLVIPLAPAAMQDKLLRTLRILHKSTFIWIFGFLLGLGVVLLGILYILDYMGDHWYSINWLMVIILQLSRFFLFYMIVTALIRHLVTAYNLNRVYHHVKLPVLIGQSKYGASFDAITGYGLSFAGFGGILGLFIAMRFFFSTPVIPEDIIYLALYIILMPLSFLLPFWQAHVNMLAAREEALNRISDSLQDEYDRLLSNIPKNDESELLSGRLITLRSLLELTEKAPTWPFENWSLYRVLAAVIFPFLMTGLGFLLDFMF